jgi:hypothetical protein
VRKDEACRMPGTDDEQQGVRIAQDRGKVGDGPCDPWIAAPVAH